MKQIQTTVEVQTGIEELNEAEISQISGALDSAARTASVAMYPEIDNDPPG